MKIIGTKSLSSAVYHLLWVLLPLGVLALLASSVWVGLELHDLFLEQTVVVFPVLAIVGLAWLSGICCCLLLWQLIGIFRRLREGNCFTPDNVPPLTRSAWCLWGIGAVLRSGDAGSVHLLPVPAGGCGFSAAGRRGAGTQ